MNETVQHPPEAPAAAEARLQQMQSQLDAIAKKVGVPDVHAKHQAPNRPLLAAAFGLGGLKLGGLLAGKIGLTLDLCKGISRNGMQGAGEVFTAVFHMADRERGGVKHLLFSMTLGTVGATLGTVGGAYLGWKRGNRLESTSELFNHPIDSLKKIFGPELHKPTAPLSVQTHPVAGIEHQGTIVAPELTQQR